MKRFFGAVGIVFCVFLSTAPAVRTGGKALGAKSSAVPVSVAPDFGKIPLYFIPNRGQVDGQALFYARTSRYTLWVTREGLVFDGMPGLKPQEKGKLSAKAERASVRDVSRMVIVGGRKEPEITAGGKSEHVVSYFRGNDPTKWLTDIPTAYSVIYHEVYPGIDLKVYGMERRVEYDWVVRPGGDPAQICFEYDGVKGARVDAAGNLAVETDLGEIVHRAPEAYQEIGSKRVRVEAEFKREGGTRYGFEAGAFDRRQELVIDPELVYSTYLGGSADDYSAGIAVDGMGCAYVTGYTYSTDFPTRNPFMTDPRPGDLDAFVTKLSAMGNTLVYSTYLGGTQDEYGMGIAVDTIGCAYVTGFTYSTDFPTRNPYMTDPGDGYPDAFVTKLSAQGNALAYSTYLGGSAHDFGGGIAVDALNCAYVSGYTWSADFPTRNPFMTDPGDGTGDVFVTKLSAKGNALVYSTYLGGSGREYGFGIAVDKLGCAYVTGYTYSPDFPIHNPYMTYPGDNQGNVFITKLSVKGNALVYSTYLGGNSEDEGFGIAVDKLGCAYVTGYTHSADFPTRNPYMSNPGYGNGDIFVTKLSAAGNALVYSTYLGGNTEDLGYGIAVDEAKCAYVTGETYKFHFPPYPIETHSNAFVKKLSAAGNVLVYSFLLVGSSDNFGYGIAMDKSGYVYVTGYTWSTDFPTYNAYQTDPAGGWDVFVTKLK